jgi:pyruvate formate lyase activating enzyme
LHAGRRIALDAGLHFVYEGNIYSDGANTSCPSCGALLVQRSWHSVEKNRLTRDGHCPKCGYPIPGRWTNPRGQTPPKIAARAQSVADAKYSHLNF